MTYDVVFQLSSIFYSAPLLRILPYLIGTMTAIYLHKNDYQLTISKVSVNFNFTKLENVYGYCYLLDFKKTFLDWLSGFIHWYIE